MTLRVSCAGAALHKIMQETATKKIVLIILSKLIETFAKPLQQAGLCIQPDKSPVNRIISTGYKCCAIGTQVENQRCNFIRLAHTSDRLRFRKLFKHLR